MTYLIAPLLLGASACYAISFAGNFFPRRGRRGAILILAGFAMQTAALWQMTAAARSLPTSTAHGLMELVGWFCAMLSLAGFAFGFEALKKIPTAAAAILTMLPACCPALEKSASAAEGAAPAIVQLHALAAMISYALMFAALAVSLAHLRKHRALKRRSGTGGESFGVPLQTLAKTAQISLVCAAGAMLLSVLLGAMGALQAGLSPRFAVKIAAGCSVLAVQAYAAYKVAALNIRGPDLAKISATVAAVAAAAVLAVELRNIF